jgi:cytosine/uracil/thiamine/allantoin permease
MSTRATYGLYGNLLPLLTTLLGNLVFAGIQAYYGGKKLFIYFLFSHHPYDLLDMLTVV